MTSKKSNETRQALHEQIHNAAEGRAASVIAALATHEHEMQAEALDDAEYRVRKIIRGSYDSRDWDAACDTVQRVLREMAAEKRAGR